MDNGTFVDEALAALRDRPDVRSVAAGERLTVELELDRPGGKRTLWLAPLLLESAQVIPAERDGWLARRLDTLLPEDELPADFESAKPGLTSVVRSTAFFGGEASLSSLVWRPVGPCLAEVLWFEHPVERSALEAWGVEAEEAFAAAGVDEGCSELQTVESDGAEIGIFESFDGSAAARALRLAGESGASVRASLGGDIVLTVPHPDLLLVARADDEDAVAKLAALGLEEYQRARKPISPLVYRPTDTGLSPVLVTEGPPAVRMAVPAFHAQLYARQREVLEASGDPRAENLFEPMVDESLDDRPGLLVRWFESDDVLLPEADLVDMGDGTGHRRLLPMPTVLAAAEDALKPVELFPKRLAPVRFPHEVMPDHH